MGDDTVTFRDKAQVVAHREREGCFLRGLPGQLDRCRAGGVDGGSA
jgi:hypothetical protein